MSRKSNKNKFRVSIIIPSYNRYPLNLNTLYALENQNFNLNKMEVILIDDASTDDTPRLNNYKPAYSFKYIRNKKKLGPSGARNIGLKQAKGKIIIFLDAEMLVGPDYVREHYGEHRRSKEQIVVIGRNKSKVYTYIFPGINSEQIEEIINLSKKNPFVENRLRIRLQLKNVSDTNLRALTEQLTTPIPLIDKEEIKTITRLKSFLKPKEIYEELYQYVSKHPNSCLTWRLCLGSNHSFKRSLLDKVGGYDEDFRGWGVEDTEFAYRLYKAGAKFVINPRLFRYHQEHPISSKKKSEQSKNRMLLKQKHPDIAIYITSLSKIKMINMEFMERVLREHKSLSRNFPGQFKNFKSAIILLLQQIDKLVLENKPLRNLLRTSGINNDAKRKSRIYSQKNKIIAFGKYKNLVQLFDILKDN